MVADFRREYAITGAHLAALGADEFRMLLAGLSHRSRFAEAWEREPKHLYDADEIAAVKAAAMK